MGPVFELVWRSGGTERAFPVHGVVTIGRGPDNDLVLPGDQVSYQHSRVWVDRDLLWVADAGSTNGTFADTTRVESKLPLAPGMTLRMGEHVLEIREIQGSASPAARWVVEDLDSGLRVPLGDRFVVGAGADADLRVEGVEAVIVRKDDVITVDGEPVPKNQFSIGTLRLRVRNIVRRAPIRTVRPDFADGCYHIQATLDARTPWARIRDEDGRMLQIEGEARATLVYVLGSAVLADREKGLPFADVGWVDDKEVAARVWGRAARTGGGNKLSVVVYRLRADLKKAGLDGEFVERSRGRIRLRAATISLS